MNTKIYKLRKELDHRIGLIEKFYNLSSELKAKIKNMGDVFMNEKIQNPESKIIHEYFFALYDLITMMYTDFESAFNRNIENMDVHLSPSERRVVRNHFDLLNIN